MNQVVAVVKPYLAEKVVEALESQPIEECVVREVKGFGRQKNYLEMYGENEYSLAYVPKVEIILWVQEQFTEPIVDLIVDVSRSGRFGDGKIFILPVNSTTSIE